MQDRYKEYWIEAVSQTAEDMNIKLSQEQIIEFAESMQISSEQQSMAFGELNIPNPLLSENKELKRELKREKEKIICKECNGRGSLTEYGPGTLMSISNCYKCNGLGFIYN